MRIGLVIAALCALVLLLRGDDRVTVAWDRNLEPDVNDYTVYVGLGPRDYGWQTNSGNATSVVVRLPATTPPMPPVGQSEPLGPLSKWYFAVTAWNTSGLESDLSDEVSWVTPVTLHLQAATELNGPWTNVGTLLVTQAVGPGVRWWRGKVELGL